MSLTDAELKKWQTHIQARVDIDPETGCWNWRSAKSHGYGSISCGRGTALRAHRFSYEVFVSPIPEGLMVRHMCNNRACVNPGHLLLGTDLDNKQDRWTSGYKGNALHAGQVAEIKRLLIEGKLSQREISIQFGVAGTTIRSIANGQTWPYVKPEILQ